MHFRNGVMLLVSLAAIAPVEAALAQAQRSGGGGEAQKFMQQYQQISREKAALQAQVTQLKTDLDAANAQLATVKKERDAAKAHVGVSPAALAQATGQKDAAERNLDKSKQQMGELVSRFRETAAVLRDVEGDRNQLKEEKAKLERELDKCASDNLDLYDINDDVLNRYAKVGLFTRVSASEPFTQLTRTRIDNLVIEYRQRAEALRYKKAEAAAKADAAAKAQKP